eukprot:NODE_51_length_27121_cov_0.309452.p14 type:complete len:161 gc:universal NODE_51_length_27121_cov_0.309452:21477-21959(+)
MSSSHSQSLSKAQAIEVAADKKAEAIKYAADKKAEAIKDAAFYQCLTSIGIILATLTVARATFSGAEKAYKIAKLNHQRDRTFKLIEWMKDTVTGRPHVRYSEGMVKIYNKKNSEGDIFKWLKDGVYSQSEEWTEINKYRSYCKAFIKETDYVQKAVPHE